MSTPPYLQGLEVIQKCILVDATNATDEDDSPICGCKPLSSDAHCCSSLSCTNFAMQMECTECFPACQNNRISKRRYAKISVKETPGKGHGLFVDQDVRPGTFIMEYVGEVISIKELIRRQSLTGKTDMMFIMQIPGIRAPTFIDARAKGSISRSAHLP